MAKGSFQGAQEQTARAQSLREDASALRVASFLTRSGRAADLANLLDAAVHLSGAQRSNIQLVDASGNLQIAAHTGFPEAFLEFFETVSTPRSACGVALEHRVPVVVKDVTRSRIFADPSTLQVMLDARCRAVESVPLLRPTGDVFGVISVHFDQPLRAAEGARTRLAPFAAALTPHVNAARRNGREPTPATLNGQSLRHRSNTRNVLEDAAAVIG